MLSVLTHGKQSTPLLETTLTILNGSIPTIHVQAPGLGPVKKLHEIVVLMRERL